MTMRHLEVLRLLNPGHPALRGYCRLSDSGAAWSRSVSVLHQSSNGFSDQQKHFTSGLLTKKDLFKTLHKPIHSLGCPRSHLFAPSSVGWHTQQTTSIHHQQRDGQRQADRQFILSPKGIFQASPPSVKPYLSLIRLDKSIGTWLLYIPCMWSISLAAPPGCLPDFSMLALFGLGAFLMRGAGCIINDMWDKDFDSRVARTKDRPLASGQVSYFQALSLLGVHLSASLAILLTMNWNTVLLGTCAMLPVITYPLMKRITYWPQAFLGLTFNWGALLGWSAIQGTLDLSIVLPLYASGIAWTLVYDTIYAHQDKEDDMLIGIKSTALKFGDDTKKWLTGFSGVMLSGLTLTGVMCDQPWLYYVGVGGVAGHILHQIITVDLDDTDDCAKKFRSNRNMGLMFWLAIVGANLLKKSDSEEEGDQSTITTAA